VKSITKDTVKNNVEIVQGTVQDTVKCIVKSIVKDTVKDNVDTVQATVQDTVQ